jgi:hypothetical protein
MTILDKGWGCKSKAVENLVGADVVHDKGEPTAIVVVGPCVEPFGREHRVLRRLDDGRAPGTVGKRHDALDPQQIVAAVLRQSTERTGKIEPVDVLL